MGREELLRRSESLHDLRGRDDLPYVPLRVFGGVNQQAGDSRRQLQATHPARFQESRFGSGAELREGVLDLPLKGEDERGRLGGREPGVDLLLKERPLLRREPLATGIGEEPIEAAGGVTNMEAHRGSSPRAGPEVGLGQRAGGPAYVLHGLKKRVGYRLQKSRNAGYGQATEPDFGRSGIGHGPILHRWSDPF